MKIYEITYITKEEPQGLASKSIQALGGNVLKESSLGSRQFAYPIKKENRGFYTTVYFEIDPEKLAELNRKLTLNEEILRHLIVTAINFNAEVNEVKAPVLEAETEIAEETAPKDELEETVSEEPKVEEAVEEPVTEKEEKEEVKEKPQAKAKPAKKAPKKAAEEPVDEKERLEALDKKLDELLKD